MYATEIETDVTDRFIEIPEYSRFKGQHVKIIIMSSIVETTKESKNLNKITNYRNDVDSTVLDEIFKEAKKLNIKQNIDVDSIMQDMNDGLS